MASYTVTGHPLNIYDLGLTEGETEELRNALLLRGVGASLTIELCAESDVAVKASEVLE
jgi:hypothetical protein